MANENPSDLLMAAHIGSIIGNTSNPDFLDHGDSPISPLAPQPLTGSENYQSWSGAVKMALIPKNKFSFVDGSIQ